MRDQLGIVVYFSFKYLNVNFFSMSQRREVNFPNFLHFKIILFIFEFDWRRSSGKISKTTRHPHVHIFIQMFLTIVKNADRKLILFLYFIYWKVFTKSYLKIIYITVYKIAFNDRLIYNISSDRSEEGQTDSYLIIFTDSVEVGKMAKNEIAAMLGNVISIISGLG